MLRLPLPVQLWFSITITKTVLMWWRVVAFAVEAGSLLWAVAGRVSIAGNMLANPSRTGTSLLKPRNMVAPCTRIVERHVVTLRACTKRLVAGERYPNRCEQTPGC